MDEVVRKLKDDSYCERITNAAQDVARRELTFERLTEKFANHLRAVL
jgi:hypothetical protein